MNTAIIAEYNPFHKGHLYHINKTKEKTIMITIKYNPNFEDLYDTIVEKYCRNNVFYIDSPRT